MLGLTAITALLVLPLSVSPVITYEILKILISHAVYDVHAYYACTTHKHIHVCTVTAKIATYTMKTLLLQYTDACTHKPVMHMHMHTHTYTLPSHTQSPSFEKMFQKP